MFQEHSVAAFQNHEERHALHPLPTDTFLPRLKALPRLRADSAFCPM